MTTPVITSPTDTTLTQAGSLFERAATSFAASVQKFAPQGMTHITLDMRFPSGKALTGVLFGTPEFAARLKAATDANTEDFFARAAAAAS